MIASFPLSEKESSRLYWELAQKGATSVGEKAPWSYPSLSEEELLVLALLQSRYDPRLLEVLIDFFKRKKFDINPLVFKQKLSQENALPLMAVVGEYVLETTLSSEVKELMRYLMIGVRPVPLQLFFLGLYRIGGRKMEELIQRPLWGFKKWGFLASDPPLSKERRKIYLFDLASRLNLLKKLVIEKKRFRLRDYLEAVDYGISRQQALKDLRQVPWIRKKGVGKGTFYQGSVSGISSMRSPLASSSVL
ncbi:MAG: hypothetical protein HYY44_05190 [Deltaproteobacteria bacterium]|nr:hypothetical protein [Deltaproteobacteria bacterium]